MNSEEQFIFDTSLKIYSFMNGEYNDKQNPPIDVDFVTGLTTKLHRKSTIVKGECVKEEFFESYNGLVYSNLIIKESTEYIRDALGFPIKKVVTLSWMKNDGEFHEQTKVWEKFYSNMEKIQEGKSRRGNLVANLQMPCIGLISIALTGTPDATPSVILEGRRFLQDYASEFQLFIDDSNKLIIDCLNNSQNNKYVSQSNYSWIDSMTPYGVTIRQFIISELTI